MKCSCRLINVDNCQDSRPIAHENLSAYFKWDPLQIIAK